MRIPDYLRFMLAVFLFACCQPQLVGPKIHKLFHLDINGAQIPVMIRGNTEARIFILHIEGGPGSSSLDGAYANVLKWKEQIEPSYAAVYYDQRGMGNAQGMINPEDFTLAQFVEDLHTVVSFIRHQYENPKIYLVGNSWGGFLGAKYLLTGDYQTSISGWISLTGAITYDFDERWQYRRQFLHDLAEQRLIQQDNTVKWTEVLAWISENPVIRDSAQKAQIRAFWEGEIPEKGGESIAFDDLMGALFASPLNLHAYLLANNNLVGDKLFEDVAGISLLKELDKISIPSLYISGQYDTNITPQIATDALPLLGTPDSLKSHTIIPNGTHDTPYEYPEIMNQHILAFIKSTL